jgi:tetratricopeptide (TPR) repeat protein
VVVVLLRIAFIAALAQVSFAQPASTRASALIDAGVDLSNRGRFNEAGEKFVQALALDPGSAEAHYLLGLVRQQSGRNDAALASFRSALRIHPSYAAAQARVCELMTVSARRRETGFESAREACRRAITLDPKDPEPHFHLGWNESKLGNRAQSIQNYRAVLRLDPKFPRVKFELAMTYLDTQQPELAIPLFRDVIESEPENGNARYQLGAALAKQGDCSAAIPLLESATESAQTQYALAGCYKKVDRGADAQAALAKVRQLREGAGERMQAKYRASVAQKYAEEGQLEKAIVEYRAALALVNDISIKIDLAVALLKKGESEEVIHLLDGESDPLGRYQLALAYFKLSRFNDAARTLESVVQARAEFAEAWYQLGVTHLRLRQPADAERALRTASQLRPDEPTIRLAWAESLEQSGRQDEAREQRTLAARTPK